MNEYFIRWLSHGKFSCKNFESSKNLSPESWNCLKFSSQSVHMVQNIQTLQKFKVEVWWFFVSALKICKSSKIFKLCYFFSSIWYYVISRVTVFACIIPNNSQNKWKYFNKYNFVPKWGIVWISLLSSTQRKKTSSPAHRRREN